MKGSLYDIWLVAGLVIGSYLNDMDHEHATAGRILPLWIFVKHREQTHSLFFALFMGCLLAIINISFGIGIFAGMMLHNLADLTTYYGRKDGLTHFFWPFKNHYRESSYRKNRAA
jgi:membrane-bound metal-dependent hydrolase YbcI (DUF457 family)